MDGRLVYMPIDEVRKQMSPLVKAAGLVFLCLVWGINWVAIKMSLEGLPPFISASFRFVFASLVLFLYVKGKRISLKVDNREFRFLLITAFLTYALDYGLIFWGEQYLSAGVTSIFFSTFTLFTALFSNFVFKSETFDGYKYGGLLLGLGGILLVFYDQLVKTRFDLMVILASVAIVLSAAAAAASTVIVKKHLSRMNTVRLSFHQLWIGAFFLVLITGIAEHSHLQRVQLTPRVLLAVVYMAVMASAAAFLVYYKLLQQMSAVSLSFTIYIIPLVALLADYLIYGEVLHLRSFVGMIIIFSGIWLSQGKNLIARKYKHRKG
jgi:drug/metabolite transporter (DMT)-like permease